MARHGGIESTLLDASRKSEDENLKIYNISQVSCYHFTFEQTLGLFCVEILVTNKVFALKTLL